MEAHKDVLCREIEPKEYKDLLIQIAEIIEECVNFGTHILAWCSKKPKKDGSDLTITLIFRHFIESLDAITVLIKHGCADPTEPLLRSIFEALIGLEYILEKDTVQRALSYEVAHAHRKISLYKKIDPTSDQGKQFKKVLSNDSTLKNIILPTFDTNKLTANLEKMLKKPQYIRIDEEWQNYKEANKRSPNWFSLFGGPKNIIDLAYHVNRGGLYEFLYRIWSQSVHVTGVIRNITKDEFGNGAIIGLRNPKNIQIHSSLSLSMIMVAYNKMIRYYIPDKEKNFKEWYTKNIRERYLQLSSTKSIIKID
jgi:hypothetical protein